VKRIFAIMMACLFMMAVMLVMAAPAFAKITPTKQNGGGQTPNGQANGVPTVNLNPAGKAPGGHN
jgi:hypothetical protein